MVVLGGHPGCRMWSPIYLEEENSLMDPTPMIQKPQLLQSEAEAEQQRTLPTPPAVHS